MVRLFEWAKITLMFVGIAVLVMAGVGTYFYYQPVTAPEISVDAPREDSLRTKAWLLCEKRLRILDPSFSLSVFGTDVSGSEQTGYVITGRFRDTGLQRYYRCWVDTAAKMTDLQFSYN